MKLPAFVPDDLRQLARFVPLRGWDAVEWGPLVSSLRSLSLRYVTGRGIRKISRAVSEVTPRLRLGPVPRGAELGSLEQPAKRKQAGDDLLHLYFSQWLVEDGLFLDLRTNRLGYHDDTLVFSPNGLWIELRPEFRQGMVALYRSFYGDDAAAFDAALRQMGMLPEGLDTAAESRLKALLHAHFGVDQGAQRFSIDAFKTSFDELFEFFLDHDYRLHSDFVFVGFYLITLYLTLERCGQAHDTRAICAEVLLADAAGGNP